MPCDSAGEQDQEDEAPCVMFSFPGRSAVRLESGGTATLKVIFRRPAKRQVELIDDDGKPVAGYKVALFVDWIAECHCGCIAGGPRLGTATSGRDGRLPVADGDFPLEVVFSMGRSAEAHMIPAGTKPGTNEARHQVIDLTRRVTRLRLHRFHRLPLAIRFTSRDLPAAGVYVGGCLAGFPSLCGAGCGSFGHHRHGRLAARARLLPRGVRECLDRSRAAGGRGGRQRPERLVRPSNRLVQAPGFGC
jgi:hypothetical protein